MLLRVSTQSEGEEVELNGVVEGAENVDERLPAGKELTAFAEAVVDAAGVVGNFERMVRIADGIGISLDEGFADTTADMREDLGLNSFASAVHTLSTA